jgi:hypothetical protein
LSVRRLVIASLLLAALPARADDIVLRGNYWRDRNTRVVQPEAILTKELPSGTILGAHYLLDTISSASVAAGVVRDQVFTELRNEVGFSVAQRAGVALLSAAYSYSSESDYWAHLITVGTTLDLLQHNTLLNLSMSYGINDAAQRAATTVYVPVGSLQTFTLIGSWSQTLTRHLLGNVEYDLTILGFGSEIGKITGEPNVNTGYQANPYRGVNVGGSPSRELVPFQRIRQSVAGSLNWIIPTENRITPFVSFRPSYRFYWDDWGILSHTPELRVYLPVGPVEFRLTGRYYLQNAATFTSEVDGKPMYLGSQGKPCTTCLSSASRGLFYTSDPKLYAFDAFFLEGRVAFRLTGLGRFTRLPLHAWLAGGVIELSYGHYFNTKVPQASFGDADLAGLSFIFPL